MRKPLSECQGMEIKKTVEEISVKMVVKTRCDKGENNGDAVNYGKREEFGHYQDLRSDDKDGNI